MEERIRFLGVIPARGGSKRIPNKNMKIINGKPLVYWSIKYAMESNYIDKLVVSTEDKKIKDYCKSLGVDVIDRPPILSGDYITLTEVMNDITNKINCENIVILRPTSPVRINNIIDKCIAEYIKKGSDSLMTGFMNTQTEWFTHQDCPSQLEKKWFQGDGCVEITSSSILQQGKTYGRKTIKFLVDDIYNYQVDFKLDLIIISAIMKHLGIQP